MKRSHRALWILAASVLGGSLWWWNRVPHRPVLQRPLRIEKIDSMRGTRAINKQVSDGLLETSTPWSRVESEDPAKWINNLRAIGCPEQTIRDLVTARLWRNYKSRLLEFERQSALAWDVTRNRSAGWFAEYRSKRDELKSALDAELQSLLGVNAEILKASLRGLPPAGGRTDFLVPEKRALVNDINRRFNQMRNDIEQGRNPSASDAEIREKLDQVEKARRQELARNLSAQEQAELHWRESPAARYALSRLPEAASEEEYHLMVEAVEKSGIPLQSPGNPMQRYGFGPADAGDSEINQARLEKSLREALGDKRYEALLDSEKSRQAEEERGLAELEAKRTRATNQLIAEEMGIDPARSTRFLDRLQELEPQLRNKLELQQKEQNGSEGEKAERIRTAMDNAIKELASEILGLQGLEFLKKMKRD